MYTFGYICNIYTLFFIEASIKFKILGHVSHLNVFYKCEIYFFIRILQPIIMFLCANKLELQITFTTKFCFFRIYKIYMHFI